MSKEDIQPKIVTSLIW